MEDTMLQVKKGETVQLNLGMNPTHPVILALPSLISARAYQPQGAQNGAVQEGPSAPRFSANFLFPAGHPDLQVVLDTCYAVAEANPILDPYGKPIAGIQPVTRDAAGNVVAVMRAKGLYSWPWQTGDEYADLDAQKRREAFRGHLILRAGTPEMRMNGTRGIFALGYFEGGDLRDIPFDERANYASQFFGGQNVYACIGIGPRKQGGAGVTAYLNGVISYNNGTPNPAFGMGEGPRTASAMFSQAQHRGVVHTQGTPMASHPTSAPHSAATEVR
jgi:hypothetical protein